MSEQEIREGLRVAVWDEPPLDFDPDALIAQAEKVRTRRRALVSVGVGTALVVVSAFALPTLFSPSRPDSANVAESPTRSSAVTAPPAPNSQQVEKVAVQAVKRLHLILPSAIGVVPEYVDDGRGVPVPPMAVGRFGWFIRFEDTIGPTAIQLQIGGHMTDEKYCGGFETCRQEAESDGSKVIIAEHYEGAEMIESMVTHVRTNGTAVTVTSFSYNPLTGSGIRKTVPIGSGGLRVLATDPQISWD
ncbi:hypothetical protein FKR81_08240 [Lentzea tibetensis]|uniref:Uncharacterized protein n=1 Tax=Lentzea tibetensis TaxID=2591470 RepID=A0A563EZL1_9PSEU|nr:hypothetical protein [Lentzea tibetensis]TWP53063.1 hypothetical protein FKR81_08240 [Lentzea tibetensis]